MIEPGARQCAQCNHRDVLVEIRIKETVLREGVVGRLSDEAVTGEALINDYGWRLI